LSELVDTCADTTHALGIGVSIQLDQGGYLKIFYRDREDEPILLNYSEQETLREYLNQAIQTEES
jgi:hypothetical protein